MNALHAAVLWPLGRNDLLTLGLQAGERVRCDRGTVWVTLDGNAEDLVLAAGEEYRAPHAQVLHASGLGQGPLAVLRQVSPVPAGLVSAPGPARAA
ncbi:MAG: DUF2917 domain-containing protein [Pseudomonadota bacterium]